MSAFSSPFLEDEAKILGLSPDEKLHRLFLEKRLQQGEVIELAFNEFQLIWPPAAIAVKIIKSKGDSK